MRFTLLNKTRENMCDWSSEQVLDYHDKLVKAGAVYLRNNCRIIDLGNSQCQIVPIDPTKKVK